MSHPFLGASPDGGVYDPTITREPYGYLEVKFPYTHRDKTPLQGCSDPKFCCTEINGVHYHLKEKSPLLLSNTRANGSRGQAMV